MSSVHPDHWECATCGHEWPKAAVAEAPREVRDAHGTVLADGDAVILIKDLKLRGGSGVLKQGAKMKSIRLVEGDHEIDGKIDGVALALKACFVEKGLTRPSPGSGLNRSESPGRPGEPEAHPADANPLSA